VVAGAAGAWWWRARVAMPALDPQKVVVAAFENQTGEASLDPLGKSTADLIRDGLTAIHGVRVVPGSTPREDRAGPGARREGDGGDDLVQQLAREAGAGLVVSGTYSLAGENLHIQARLTDARSGQFWAFPPALGSRSAPMTAVAAARQRVMGAVAVRVDPTWLGLPDASPPTYDAYQEYRVYIEAGDDPLPHLSRAVELDPDFVLARINLINYLSRSGGYAEAARHVAILEGRKARLTASQRLLVDAVRATLAGRTGEAYLAASEVKRLWPAEPGAIEVYSWFARNAYRFRDAVNALAAPIDWGRLYANSRFRGGLYFLNLTMMLHQLGEHERELLEARRGQHLHPGISSLRDREASALAALGRLDEMERVVTERLALASAGQGGHLLLQVGLELRAHGHRDASAKAMARAQEALQRCSAEEARTQDVREELALLLRVLGRLDEARAIYDRLAREAPADTEKALVWMGDRGVVAALRGERAAALRISDQLARLERPYLFGVHMYERARIAAQLGEKERAVDLLRSAFAQGFTLSSESTWLHVEPSFDALRGHPPFEEVVAPQ
jgi:tetratricopeptide (TPR) repeat protein/TolB-like protein